MDFLHSDLGQLNHGAVVEFTLRGNQANVRLMDSANLSAYRAQRGYHFYGGLAKASPVRLAIPHSGHWYAVVDMKGLGGNKVEAKIRVL